MSGRCPATSRPPPQTRIAPGACDWRLDGKLLPGMFDVAWLAQALMRADVRATLRKLDLG